MIFVADSIDKAFAAIIKDCQAVAAEAVKNAAKKVQKDIVKESYRYLAKYYASYHPKVYKRTKSLHKAIVPVLEDHSTNNGTSIEVGVLYDSSLLKNMYKSKSRWHQSGSTWVSRLEDEGFNFDSGDNGIPEPGWILDNFLRGEHGGVQQDSESTNSLMENFFDTILEDKVPQYVQEEFFDAIFSRL